LVTPLFAHPLTGVSVGEVANGAEILLSGAEAKHAISVRRMRVGEAIQLANGSGLRAVGVISSIDDSKGGQSLIMTSESVVQETKPEPALVLIQALAKGDRDELAIQAATELGAFGVIPWQADRSVSRWEGAKIAKGVERWQSIVTEAAKQALRAFTPVVENPITTKQLVAKQASGSSQDFAQVLVLDPTASQSLSTVELASQGLIAIVVGPEGGITDHELDLLEKAGAVRVHLGESILRTSTAGMAAISVLQSRMGAWQ
jgi:16S rRNA (uracil1498-N3)-methyltransferase